MNRLLPLVGVAVLAAAGGAAAGYWLARHPELAVTTLELPSAISQAAESSTPRAVLYYRDPSGQPYWSAMPKKDAQGRDYLPVHEDKEPDSRPGPVAAQAAAGSGERKILYYRHPMGLPDVSPVPRKDAMGMDYIPVYEGEEQEQEDASVVRVSLDRVQRLGVRTEPVVRRGLARQVRATGTIQADERRLAVVTTKIEGWIEKLLVNATGEPVRRGQALMRVYSPALVQAQQEYVLALQAAQAAAQGGDGLGQRLAEGAERRLRNLDFPADQLERLRRDGEARRLVTLRAPASGVVLEKMAVEGMRFLPGEPLYRLADLSTVWVVAEVPEQDLPSVAVGQKAAVTLKARPDRTLEGQVAFVYPTITPATRTGKVRIELANPKGELKTDMYASVELQALVGAPDALAVPASAVIDSGARQIVLVERGEGRFEPRPVRLGARGSGYVEVREGVQEGERVVVTANFLIDAESNLQAALRAFTASGETSP